MMTHVLLSSSSPHNPSSLPSSSSSSSLRSASLSCFCRSGGYPAKKLDGTFSAVTHKGPTITTNITATATATATANNEDEDEDDDADGTTPPFSNSLSRQYEESNIPEGPSDDEITFSITRIQSTWRGQQERIRYQLFLQELQLENVEELEENRQRQEAAVAAAAEQEECERERERQEQEQKSLRLLPHSSAAHRLSTVNEQTQSPKAQHQRGTTSPRHVVGDEQQFVEYDNVKLDDTHREAMKVPSSKDAISVVGSPPDPANELDDTFSEVTHNGPITTTTITATINPNNNNEDIDDDDDDDDHTTPPFSISTSSNEKDLSVDTIDGRSRTEDIFRTAYEEDVEENHSDQCCWCSHKRTSIDSSGWFSKHD